MLLFYFVREFKHWNYLICLFEIAIFKVVDLKHNNMPQRKELKSKHNLPNIRNADGMRHLMSKGKPEP